MHPGGLERCAPRCGDGAASRSSLAVRGHRCAVGPCGAGQRGLTSAVPIAVNGNPETNAHAEPASPSSAHVVSGAMSATGVRPEQQGLTGAISAAIVALYAAVYGHQRTTATTYINDNIVVCVLESILTAEEDILIARGSGDEVIDGRVGFQTETEDEFTAAIERLTHRRVTAFLSANQTTPGVACELFFLDSPPLPLAGQGGM